MTVDLLSSEFEPRESRPLPWRMVGLATVLVVILGIAVSTVARRSGDSGSSTVSVGVLTAAQAKTAASNDFKLQMKLGFSGQGQHVHETFTGAMSVHPAKLSMTGALPAGLGTLDERALGHTIYMRIGDHVTTGGRHWVSLTLADTGSALGAESDPLGNLRLLAGASGKVTKVGKKKINGAQTTHYRATVDPVLAFQRVPDSLKVPGSDEAVAGLGLIPVDVYIAADGTVRRVDDKVKSGGLTATIEMTLTPIKEHVSVVAPPRSDVTPVQSISDVFMELGLPGPAG